MSNNLVFMKGTGGKLDYLVVHKKGNVLAVVKNAAHVVVHLNDQSLNLKKRSLLSDV